jgi:hypothetical protein
MYPNFCGAIGLAGWLAMLLTWTGLVAVVVWGVTRLFPGPSGPVPPDRRPGEASEAPPSLVDSGRH